MTNQTEQITADQLNDLMKLEKIKVVSLDVRSSLEYNRYHIKGALHINIDNLSIEALIKALNLKNDEEVIVVTYCNAGGRGGRSFKLLKEQNKHENIHIKNLTHGINQWIDRGYPVEENLVS